MYHSESADRMPELPALEPGISLLERVGGDRRSRQVTVLHALVLDHLLMNAGTVRWIDVRGHATAHPLGRLAPSTRTLDRIRVARAFTPHQHAQSIRNLAAGMDENVSLVVCPAFDHHYREECRDPDATDLLLRGVATMARLAREFDVPVVMTRTRSDDLSEPLVEAAGERITYERTKLGPRFEGDDFETLVYPAGHGTVQTTLAFWKEVLAARRPLYEGAGAREIEVGASGSH